MSDYVWARTGISNKWPATRAIGPDVSVENALEFIRRTDNSLVSGYQNGNSHIFQRAYEQLVNISGYSRDISRAMYDDKDGADKAYNDHWHTWNHFAYAFGHVRLNHLQSDWVHCCYIGGPHGLVSPAGKIRLAQNFGKWPSVRQIERELRIVAREFPWLTFYLGIWDSEEEGAAVSSTNTPTMAWHVENGAFERVSVDRFPSEGKTTDEAVDVFLRSRERGQTTEQRECFFTIDQIDLYWGDKIRAAAARVKDPRLHPGIRGGGSCSLRHAFRRGG